MVNSPSGQIFNKKVHYKYRFPLWLTIFFLLLILIPILIFFDYLILAKIIGISCLILIIIALRIWLRISRINSEKVERVVLNKNQVFDLHRKYSFLKSLNNSDREILFHRTGLVLAEVTFIAVDEIFLEEKIELAFYIAIIFFQDDYTSLKGLVLNVSKMTTDEHISLSTFYDFRFKSLLFIDFKAKLTNSDFGKIISSQLTDLKH